MSQIDILTSTLKAVHPVKKYAAVDLHTLDMGCIVTGSAFFGVCQRDVVNSGEAAPIQTAGETNFLAGLAVTPGQRLTKAASGFLVPVTSGQAAPTFVAGYALTTTASGMVGIMQIERYFNGTSGAAL
jgi:hypothetical protein